MKGTWQKPHKVALKNVELNNDMEEMSCDNYGWLGIDIDVIISSYWSDVRTREFRTRINRIEDCISRVLVESLQGQALLGREVNRTKYAFTCR